MTDQNQQETKIPEHKKGNPPKFKNALDRINRRERRKDNLVKYNNNRIPKNSGFLNMGVAWDGAVIYMPKRKKFKGFMRNNKQ